MACNASLIHQIPHISAAFDRQVGKAILYKILGKAKIGAYKSFMTILKQIVAVLNSRPLYALTEDPNDDSVLTPAHFSIGKPVTLLPEPSLWNEKTNLLDLYQKRQQLVQTFWNTWSSEYLQQLQKRTKWQFDRNNIRTNQIAIVHEENCPPAQWKIARIIETFPGPDGKIRVVKIRIGNNEYTRPIVKLSLLPIIDNEN